MIYQYLKVNEKINEEENNSNNISNNNDIDNLDRQKKFDKNNNISPQGFRSKGIQELLMKRKINQDINQRAPEINFNDSHNEQKENEEKKEEIHESGDKTDFNNLLSSNNNDENAKEKYEFEDCELKGKLKIKLAIKSLLMKSAD